MLFKAWEIVWLNVIEVSRRNYGSVLNQCISLIQFLDCLCRHLMSSLFLYETGGIGVCTQQYVLALEGTVCNRIQLFLYVHAHDLQTRGQNDVGRTVRTVIILVNVTSDHLYTLSFLCSCEYTIAGTTCCYEDNITALIDQSLSNYLAGCLICKASYVVAAYIGIGYVCTCIACDLYYLNSCVVLCIGIVNAGLKSILVVYIRGIGNTIYNRYLLGLGLKSCSHTCEESAFLLLKCHGIYIIRRNLGSLCICREGIYQNKLHIRVVHCDTADSCKLEAAAYDYVIISYDIGNCLNGGSCITGLFSDRSNRSIRIGFDKVQNTVVIILIKGTVIYSGWAADDSDL